MLVEVGQVLSLIIRFNNNGEVSSSKHPYLIVKTIDNSTIELAQFDKVKGKEWKAAFESNKVVYADNPSESVIDQDSFIQMDNTIQVEYYDGLITYRRQTDKLSEQKLKEVVDAYNNYHLTHQIDENKQVYMDKDEIERLNS